MDPMQQMAKNKRARDDKISKLMGDYLLKGYKMLSSTCSTCGTILLRDRKSQDYCVACSEVDTIAPVVTLDKVVEDVVIDNLHTNTRALTDSAKTSQAETQQASAVENNKGPCHIEQRFHGTAVKLQERIGWATSQLGCGNSIEMDIKLSELICTCGKALKALRELQVE